MKKENMVEMVITVDILADMFFFFSKYRYMYLINTIFILCFFSYVNIIVSLGQE